MGRKKGIAWKQFNVDGKGVQCKYCNRTYKVPNVNKMERHLLKCSKCPQFVRRLFLPTKQTKKGNSNSDYSQFEDLAPSSSSSCTSSLNLSQSNTRNQQQIKTFLDTMNKSENEQLDQALAKAILISGSPISIVEHPLWIEFFKQIRPSYKLPSRKRISTTSLDAEYKAMQEEIKLELENSKHMHLQCDGWSSLRNESIINFVITTPEPRFVEFVLTEKNKHDAPYLAKQVQNIMEKYGPPDKFLVVIGDNAANMRAAFRLLNETFRHIVPLGCIAHLLHLLCNDILGCESVKLFMQQVTEIVKTIKRSHQLQAMFVKIGKEKNINISLKLAGKTRWGSNLFSLQSIFSNKVVLQTLAVSDEVTVSPQLKSRILDDAVFWVKVEKMIGILKPIVDLITKLETNNPLIHVVHHEINQLQSKLSELLPGSLLSKAEENKILQKIEERKKFGVGKIHLAADLLNPASQGSNLNPTEMIDAMEFICEVAANMNYDIGCVRSEIADYRDKQGLWSKTFLWQGDTVSPLIWWRSLRGTNLLADISVKILSAPITSAATERSFKAFSDIHSPKRNRLTTLRAAKIAYLAHNWKLKNKIPVKNIESNTALIMDPSIPSTSTSQNSETLHEPLELEELVEINSEYSDSEYSDTEIISDDASESEHREESSEENI